jgi:hypothetical protein
MNVSRQYSGFLNQATKLPLLVFCVILVLLCVLVVGQGWQRYQRVLTEQTLVLQRQSDNTAAQINRYLKDLDDSVKRFIVQHETHILDLALHPGDIVRYARLNRPLNTFLG